MKILISAVFQKFNLLLLNVLVMSRDLIFKGEFRDSSEFGAWSNSNFGSQILKLNFLNILQIRQSTYFRVILRKVLTVGRFTENF